MYKPEDFWKWFGQNQSTYLTLGEIADSQRDAAIDTMQQELEKFCAQLYFEIEGDSEDHRGELIISAAGDPDYFPQVKTLVDAAPEFEDWKIIAFKQAQPIGFKITYEGREFDPDDTIVIPLLNDEFPDSVGVQICFEDFEESNEELFMGGTFLMLEALIGEEAAVTDIEYLEVCKVPLVIEDIEFLMLSEIQEHIAFVQNQE